MIDPTTPEAAERALAKAVRQFLRITDEPNGDDVCQMLEYGEAVEAMRAALAAQEGGGGDEYQSAITQDQVDRARNAFFKKMMLGFGVDDCFFAALHAAQEGTSNG